MSYNWLKPKDVDAALQMQRIGIQMKEALFIDLLDIEPAWAAQWQAQANEQVWIETKQIPAIETYSKAATAKRDGLTSGPGKAPYGRAQLMMEPAPIVPAGIVLRDDFNDEANVWIKTAKTKRAFTPELQEQFGLVVHAPASEQEQTETPSVGTIKLQDGGGITVSVYVGHSPMAIVQLNVDNAGWPVVGEGGKYEKTLVGSVFEFGLPPGMAHSVMIREAFADRQGNKTSNWSEIKTVSSLA